MITPFSENRHKPTTLVPDISLSLSRVLLTIPQRVRASFKTTSSVSSFMHYSGHERPKDLFDAADSPASEDFLRQVEADAAQLEDGRLGWVVRLDEPIHEQKHRLLRIGEDQILPAAEGRPWRFFGNFTVVDVPQHCVVNLLFGSSGGHDLVLCLHFLITLVLL